MEKFCFASFDRQSPRENIKKDKKFISYNGPRVCDSPTRPPQADGADFAYPLFGEVARATRRTAGNPRPVQQNRASDFAECLRVCDVALAIWAKVHR